MQTEQTPSPAPSRHIGREILSWILHFAVALVIVWILTTFVFQLVTVDGTSMQNTLMDEEVMFVTKYQYIFGDPQRFDVVICHYPGRGNTNFVKRVVGIPGDVIAMREGVLYVNGEMIDEGYIDYPSLYPMMETVVQADHYFVMGDNRANSNDSRAAGVGQLHRDDIKGKVRAVIWPLRQIRAIH